MKKQQNWESTQTQIYDETTVKSAHNEMHTKTQCSICVTARVRN